MITLSIADYRVRPLNEKELRYNDPSVITFPGNGQMLASIIFDIIYILAQN